MSDTTLTPAPRKACPWPDCPHGDECVHAVEQPPPAPQTGLPSLASAIQLARECGAWEPDGLPSDWTDGDIVFSPPQLEAYFRKAIAGRPAAPEAAPLALTEKELQQLYEPTFLSAAPAPQASQPAPDAMEAMKEAREVLRDAAREFQDRLDVHAVIRADDPQYEDPEEWTLRPLVERIAHAINTLDATLDEHTGNIKKGVRDERYIN